MLNSNIDLGQLIVAGMIGVIGFFVKRELSTITRRLDRHDRVIMNMFGGLNRLLGKTDLRIENMLEDSPDE